MTRRRGFTLIELERKGFTLIELLVVIAIIGILAAMLFPVFARARESARKTQCLANIKNIAIAVNMYLTDYDKIWPSETRQDVFADSHPNNPDADTSCTRNSATLMNPYLQPPVILDDYTKNRQIWTCPSAHTSGVHGISNPEGMDWFAHAMTVPTDQWGNSVGQCCDPYPPGWGGTVTDSNLQGGQKTGDGGPGAFANSINTISLRDVSTSAMGDASNFVVCGDAVLGVRISNPEYLAYDVFAICGANPGNRACCGGNWVDWANCAWSRDCGADHDGNYQDAEYRKKNAHARHLGGANVGFADGHAKWFNSEDILNNRAPYTLWRYNCYAVNDGVKQQVNDRQSGTWGGFENGVCGMWGAFGLVPGGCN